MSETPSFPWLLVVFGGIAAVPLIASILSLAVSSLSHGGTSEGVHSSPHGNPGNPGNPEAKIDAKFESQREEKRREWRAAGYPEGMIEKALVWAEEYSLAMASKITTDPDLRFRIEQELYPKSLEMAQKWIKGFVEFLK